VYDYQFMLILNNKLFFYKEMYSDYFFNNNFYSHWYDKHITISLLGPFQFMSHVVRWNCNAIF